MFNKVIILISSLATDQIQIVNSRRLETALEGKRLIFDKVDGSLAESKDLRDQLFTASGIRGKYPQCFIYDDSSNSYRFVGLWEEIESLLDCEELASDVLASNPQIQTFSKVNLTFILLLHLVKLPYFLIRCSHLLQKNEKFQIHISSMNISNSLFMYSCFVLSS